MDSFTRKRFKTPYVEDGLAEPVADTYIPRGDLTKERRIWTPGTQLTGGGEIWSAIDPTDESTIFQASIMEIGVGDPGGTLAASDGDPIGSITDVSVNRRHMGSGSDSKRFIRRDMDGTIAMEAGLDDVLYHYNNTGNPGDLSGQGLTNTAQTFIFAHKPFTSRTTTALSAVVGKGGFTLNQEPSVTSNDIYTLVSIIPPEKLNAGIDYNDAALYGDQWQVWVLNFQGDDTFRAFNGFVRKLPDWSAPLISGTDGAGDVQTSSNPYCLNQSLRTSTAGVGGYYGRSVTIDGPLNEEDFDAILEWVAQPYIAQTRSEQAAVDCVKVYFPIDEQDVANETLTEVATGIDLRSNPLCRLTLGQGSGGFGGLPWYQRGGWQQVIWQDNNIAWREEVDIVWYQPGDPLTIDLANEDYLAVLVWREVSESLEGEFAKVAFSHSNYWMGSSASIRSVVHHSQILRNNDEINYTNIKVPDPSFAGGRSLANLVTQSKDPAESYGADELTPIIAGVAQASYWDHTAGEMTTYTITDEPDLATKEFTTTAAPVLPTPATVVYQQNENWDANATFPLNLSWPEAAAEYRPTYPFQMLTLGGSPPSGVPDVAPLPAKLCGYLLVKTTDDISLSVAKEIAKFCLENWTHNTRKAIPSYLLKNLAT